MCLCVFVILKSHQDTKTQGHKVFSAKFFRPGASLRDGPGLVRIWIGRRIACPWRSVYRRVSPGLPLPSWPASSCSCLLRLSSFAGVDLACLYPLNFNCSPVSVRVTLRISGDIFEILNFIECPARQVVETTGEGFGVPVAITTSVFLMGVILHEPPQERPAGGKVGWWFRKRRWRKSPALRFAG